MSVPDPVRVPVDLGARAYDILVGPGLLAEAGRHMATVMPKRRAVVVTDETVARLHLAALEAALDASGIAHARIVVPTGEKTKDFAHLERLIDDLLDMRVERSTMLVALGGGVVGDLTGFAAAIALRGLDYVQVPTTLLSQVDSSVGGKTAINTRRGKNLVGAFHQPRLVLADTALLATLPRREMLAGHAEVIKYGLIDDPDFFAWLEANQARMLAGDAGALVHAVVTSCRAKARIVAADEREAGARALLNLGHTFGHAIEAEARYEGEVLHGEAVAVGMVLAFELSQRLGHCAAADVQRARRAIAAAGLPTAMAAVGGRGWNAERLIAHMHQDKKVRDGSLTFVLARGVGQAFLAHGVSADAVRPLLEAALAA
ncbi:MAG: 3-dehydroquinate synthase [Alphaproteobacteria bacterium]|nr:3-dehydroquinate synthase [Alphaproteobacteria bacterium]